jgi:hypothetical protein
MQKNYSASRTDHLICHILLSTWNGTALNWQVSVKYLYLESLLKLSTYSYFSENKSDKTANNLHEDLITFTILIKRTNSMHQYADIYLLQRQTLHISGVTAPILRSSKNCICYLWYRSWFWYRYFLPPWPVRIRPRWKEVAVPIPWPTPEVADTVFGTPGDGRCDTRNM